MPQGTGRCRNLSRMLTVRRRSAKDRRAAQPVARLVRAQPPRPAVAAEPPIPTRSGFLRSCCSRRAWLWSWSAIRRFMARFPTLVSLALAAGAGGAGAVERPGLLPPRAHAAQGGAVCGRASRGNLPGGPKNCAHLPGIGAYTAAAIASIAHGERGGGCGRQRGARAVPRGGMGGGQPQRRRRSAAAQD